MASKLKLKQSSIDFFLRPKQTKTLKPKSTRRPLSPAAAASPSDYERLRQETIRRNRDFLQKLGLSSVSPAPKPHITKRIAKPPSPPHVPIRRSTRKSGPPPPPADDGDGSPLPSAVELVESSVFRYACDVVNESPFIPPSSFSPNSASPIAGFKVAGRAFRDPSLSKIYTLDACFFGKDRFLVASGGHGGFISVYGSEVLVEGEDLSEGESQRPLMSWKGSRSWISGVMFMENNPMLLISSSNDGKVIVWDIKKQPNLSSSTAWVPPVATESAGLYSSGIFSMDRFDCFVATASKDSSVGISRLSSAGELVAEHNITGHHAGAIRGVCFGDEKDKLADSGADGRICILDPRLPEPCSTTIESQHSTGVNTVEWCRANKFLLLTASKDPVLLLYDIRSSAEPLYKLSGHVESTTRTCHQIYRPSFVDGGRAIATSGQGSGKISLFSVEKGTLLSQGMLGYDANLVKSFDDGAAIERIWAAGRQLNQLCPLRTEKLVPLGI